MKKRIKLLALGAFLMLSFSAQSQVYKAVVDNYVLAPYTTHILDVLKNDEIECTVSKATLRIPGEVGVTASLGPKHGILKRNPNNTLTYTPTDGYYGADEFTYGVRCSDSKALYLAKVYIQVADLPDNMVPEVCAITPPSFTWAIKASSTSSPTKITVARPWYVGNLDRITNNPNDPNRFPEIVTHGGNTTGADEGGKKITVFRNGNLKDPFTFNTVLFNDYYTVSGIGLSRFSNGDGAIVVNGQDGYLYAYRYPGGGLVWKSDKTYVYGTTANDLYRSGAAIAFANFDPDAYPAKQQIYVGNKIFDLDTGKLLCEGGATGNKGFSIQNNTFAGGMVSVAVDVDHDGYPELVAGNTAYKVKNNAGTWKMTLYKMITPPRLASGPIVWQDGHVSLADFNNDGHVDAFIQTIGGGTTDNNNKFFAYGWDIYNNKILFTYEATIPSGRTGIGSRSLAFIGDLDGNGTPEIAFIEEQRPQVSRDAVLRAFKLPTTLGPTAKLVPFWSMPITESAGRTGISLFDFNLDGISEVIYRDEVNLRIIDGSLKKQATPYNLASIPSVSSTTWEMPVVADIDGDGSAEIICAGGELGEDWVATGYMKIFKSGNSSNWAPSRSVWNQYAYNPTFVNEDLTAPLSPLNMATSLYGHDGVTRRPYNNFLQQAPIMTMEGISLYAAANLLFDAASPAKMAYDEVTDKMTLTFGIQNDGNIDFRGPIDVQLYGYSQTPTSKYIKVGAKYVYGNASSNLGVSSKASLSYVISNFSTYISGVNLSSWYLTINTIDKAPNAPQFFATQAECKEADNLTSSLSFTHKERTMCEYTTEDLILPNMYAYKWYKTSTGGTALPTVTGNPHILSHTKNLSLIEYYFVETFAKGEFSKPGGKPISTVRDTVFVYLRPDSLVWTGAESADWNNFRNWENPADIFKEHVRGNIPRSCTHVLIPAGLTRYPNLSTTVTSSEEYFTNECDHIHFAHGGELLTPNRLIYSKAYVDVNMESNRWTMFSPPLKQLYSGDIYVKDKNPFKDDVLISTRLFDEKNPQTGYYKEGAWTGKYNTPSVDFVAGSGLAVWVNDKKDYPSILVAPHNPFLFRFPKHDSQHHLYDKETGAIVGNIPVARGQEHRFVFDGMPNASGVFTVPLKSTGAGKLYLVGNPFMSHLNFTAFRAANSTKIANYYQVMDKNGVYQYYNKSGNTLTANIAPMQSFIIETTSAFTTGLVFNATTMTTSVPGDKLRNTDDPNYTGGDVPVGPDDVIDDNILSINLVNGDREGFISSTSVVLNPTAKPTYIQGEDVPKILFTYTDFLQEASVLYTRSVGDDGIMLSVNELSLTDKDSIDIPLGVRAVKANQDLSFFITGQWNFARGIDVYLYDSYENKRYNLRESSWYHFTNTTAQGFLEDRFVLQLGARGASGIDETPESSLRVIGSHGSIVVESGRGEFIDQVKVYDLQGRLVTEQIRPSSSRLELRVPSSSVYVVEVRTQSEATVKKVITY